MDVLIRKATPADGAHLTAIAQAAKLHWGYSSHWLTAWRDALTITPDPLEQMDVFVAALDGQAVGFYALSSTGAAVSLEHLWIAPEWMGHGIGSLLFAHAVARAQTSGAVQLTIESDPNAEGFYQRMGARRTGSVPAPLPEAPDRHLPVLEYHLRDTRTV